MAKSFQGVEEYLYWRYILIESMFDVVTYYVEIYLNIRATMAFIFLDKIEMRP